MFLEEWKQRFKKVASGTWKSKRAGVSYGTIDRNLSSKVTSGKRPSSRLSYSEPKWKNNTLAFGGNETLAFLMVLSIFLAGFSLFFLSTDFLYFFFDDRKR